MDPSQPNDTASQRIRDFFPILGNKVSRALQVQLGDSARLKAQYKQERKGAIRELRKDSRFIASVEHQKQMDKDKSYNDRMKRVFASIEPERAEQKAVEREKAKEKRRAGRK